MNTVGCKNPVYAKCTLIGFTCNILGFKHHVSGVVKKTNKQQWAFLQKSIKENLHWLKKRNTWCPIYVVWCLLPENIIHMQCKNRDQILTYQYFLIDPCHLFSSHKNFTFFVILIFKYATPVKKSLFPPVCTRGDIIILWVRSQVSNSCH